MCGQPWKLTLLPIPFDARNAVPDTLERVGIADVPTVSVHDEEIFVAIEVHVEERGPPRPVRCCHSGKIGNLCPRAVSTRQLECIAHPLAAVSGEADLLGQRRVRGNLALSGGERGAEHVRREKVDVPVAVHIRKVHRHARVARFPHRERGRQPEIAPAVVDPELVGVLEIVADVQVWCTITIHVVEPRRQREEVRIRRERTAVFVQEAWAGDRHAGKVAMPVVEEEQVDFCALRPHDPAEILSLFDTILLLPRIDDLVRAVDLLDRLVHRARLRRICIERVALLVRGDVQVECAIAVHVGEGKRRDGVATGKSAAGGGVREMTLAVVQPELERPAERAADEVERAVPIDVGEGSARRGQPSRIDSAACGYVGEMEVAVVVIESSGSFYRGEKHIGSTVAVDVAQCSPGADEEVAICHRMRVIHVIAMHKARGSRCQLREARVATARNGEISPAVPCFLVPRSIHGRSGRAGKREDEHRCGTIAEHG